MLLFSLGMGLRCNLCAARVGKLVSHDKVVLLALRERLGKTMRQRDRLAKRKDFVGK